MYFRASCASLLALLAVFAGITLCSTPSRADFVINVGDAAVTPGGVATVPVFIRSTLAGGEPLNNFSFEFRINTLGPTELDFLDPQLDEQLTQPDYVFVGNSASSSFPPVGAVATTVVPNDTFIGGDSTLDDASVTVPSTGLLLALLNVTTLTALPPQIGDTFSIALIAGDNTAFFATANDRVPIGFIEFAGLVEVVPEPSALSLLILGAMALLRCVRRVRISDHFAC